MLTKTDIREELEKAGIGPVVMAEKFCRVFGLAKMTPYHWMSAGQLTRAGRGAITRDSIEKLVMEKQELFCRLYDYNREEKAV